MLALVYNSGSTQCFTEDDLKSLLETSASINKRNGITGYLHYGYGFFFQYIEGTADAVAETMGRIKKDPRHNIFYQATEDGLASRRFPNWHMNWLGPRESAEFKPTIIDSVSSLEPINFLKKNTDLKASLAVYHKLINHQQSTD